MSDISEPQPPTSPKNYSSLKILAVVFTILGFSLFIYLVLSIGLDEIIEGIGKIGFIGFGVILFLFLLRLIVRALAWKMSIADPHVVSFSDTFQAVLIGEAVQSIIPLGIVASGTSKAVAISNRVPFVIGISSVATENLFYSLITALFLISGAVVFLFGFQLDYYWAYSIYAIIGVLISAITFGFLMIFREWRWVSFLTDWVLKKGILPKRFANASLAVHHFEDNILDFYRNHSDRFLPIVICQILYHVWGIAEVLFILTKISDRIPTLYSAFLLESVSRIVAITFKLIPFAAGVDEASSQFIAENLGLGIGVGVTIAILRKARILFWALIGMIIILKRELPIKTLLNKKH